MFQVIRWIDRNETVLVGIYSAADARIKRNRITDTGGSIILDVRVASLVDAIRIKTALTSK